MMKLSFNRETLEEYNKYYFEQHPRASRIPLEHPYHASINEWMIMRRPMMNALKQKWKAFTVWFIENQGLSNLHIEKCELHFVTYYYTNRRHDVDNSVPKFIIDGLCESGFIIDDDHLHITKLTLECGVDIENPRTEIYVNILEGEKGNGNKKEENNKVPEGSGAPRKRGEKDNLRRAGVRDRDKTGA